MSLSLRERRGVGEGVLSARRTEEGDARVRARGVDYWLVNFDGNLFDLRPRLPDQYTHPS